VIIASSLAFNDNSLDGSPADYRALARVLRAGEGTVALRTEVDVTPYDGALAEVVVHRTEGDTVLMSVDREANRFVIEGPERLLEIVAQTLENAAEVHDPKGHVHLDPFPGHFYLDEQSAQLIINDSRP
jgi:hypothetical protein